MAVGSEHVGAFVIRKNPQMLRFQGTIDKNNNYDFFPRPVREVFISSSKLPLYTLGNCKVEPRKELQLQEQ